MDQLVINDDTRGLGLLRQSPPSSPQFPSGGDADGDRANSNEQGAEVLS